MISGSLAIPASHCCSSAKFLESNDINLRFSSSSSKRFSSTITCNVSSSSNNNKIPKLEPFSRSKFERGVKDPPLIEKSENQLADYCSALEGEDSYSCWQAYFELKDLEKESPKQEVERLIIEAGGVKSLIGCIHGVTAIHKAHKEASENPEKEDNKVKNGEERKIPTHIPDGLPKTAEELEEEEKGRMPDSPFTRMLRHRGKHPAWYSPVPDHETD
ncbi:CCG-binding protein 1 [Beta vulgaris subsp. vulgaris]|uniref:CCG-binding protein 1 n=1 Tax=Beta vulgaris subsp. vulgaris TaxID=3555 RepID=UPI0020367398|nr:CCG-binding protein 1 [Beta vulgaris subsp. vulgaris]